MSSICSLILDKTSRDSSWSLSLWGLLDWVHVVEGVEVLAHHHSLSPLLGHLLLGQWSEEDGEHRGVDDRPPLPGWNDSGSAGVGEVSLLDVQEVGCGE